MDCLFIYSFIYLACLNVIFMCKFMDFVVPIFQHLLEQWNFQASSLGSMSVDLWDSQSLLGKDWDYWRIQSYGLKSYNSQIHLSEYTIV